MMDREYLAHVHPEIVMLEPPELDVAILGLVERCGSEPVLCYSVKKLVQHFIDDGMSDDDAVDYVQFNIVDAYVGPYTPMYLTDEWGD